MAVNLFRMAVGVQLNWVTCYLWPTRIELNGTNSPVSPSRSEWGRVRYTGAFALFLRGSR